MKKRIILRTAIIDDLEFLFQVSTEAMRPVVQRLRLGEAEDGDAEFCKYKEKFEPSKIQIIQYNGHDVGRLRIVRSKDSIYVGGIQILPTFQGLGIGTSIFENLIEESRQAGIPVVLEVHNVNTSALRFYKKLGFIEAGKDGDKTILEAAIK